jgi:hypothetical protein
MPFPPARPRHTFGLVMVVHLALALPAAAQAGTSGLIGHIFDQNTNESIAHALIFLDSVRREVPISGQGRFVLSSLLPGRHRVEIRAIGYRPHLLEITLVDGQVLERQIPMLFTGATLPEISVEGQNSKPLARLAEFERRRQKGLGSFITRDQIRAKGFMNMGDALRTIQGVKVDCAAAECSIHMSRSSAGCFPIFYVDGNLARSFAVTTPITDVEAIEVYRGAAEMPAEYTGSGAMCGVIVIWTRASP